MLLSPYAVPSGAAVGASLVWFVFAVLLPAALGAIWLVAERARSRMRRSDRFRAKADPAWKPISTPLPPNPLTAEAISPGCDSS